jgi:hypothetical protein
MSFPGFTLMYSKIAAVTENDRIHIFALRIITYSTGRVFGRHSVIRLGYVLCLIVFCQ